MTDTTDQAPNNEHSGIHPTRFGIFLAPFHPVGPEPDRLLRA